MNHNLVLSLDQAGSPFKWLTWEDAVVAHCKENIAWSTGDETVYRGGKSRLTGETSTVAVPSIIAIKNTHKVVRKAPPLTNRDLFGRDKYLCVYCGNQFPAALLTRDHIIPVSRGGKNIWMNVVSACKKCNCHKDNKLLSECGYELLYLPYVPSRVEHLILANRRILGDQMAFLLKCLPDNSRLHTVYS